MDNEHLFAYFNEATGASTTTELANESRNGAAERIRAALEELNHVRIGPMSRTEANQTLGLLGQAQSVVTSLMCDVGRQVAVREPDTDAAEVLRQGARLPSRESKRMVKVARQLSEMPKVKKRFATGEITPTHVNALANAAQKVGPQVVEADDGLIEAADQMLPDSFDRHARKWADRKLIEQGLDPLEPAAPRQGGQAMGGEGNRARGAHGQGPSSPVRTPPASHRTATTCISCVRMAPAVSTPMTCEPRSSVSPTSCTSW